jgi:hypothetical protein
MRSAILFPKIVTDMAAAQRAPVSGSTNADRDVPDDRQMI